MEWGNSDAAASLRRTTALLDMTIEFVEQDLSLDLRRCVPDALLRIALSRLFARDGRDGALRVLTALAAAVASGADPAVNTQIPPARGWRPAGHRTVSAPVGQANVVRIREMQP